MNYKMLKMITDQFSGKIIVPITLVNPNYYYEIITKLIEDGITVKHYILYCSKETIIKRLKARSIGMIARESFAVNSIERCLKSFDTLITEEKIETDKMSIDEVVESIAKRSNITLQPDDRTKIKKSIDRNLTVLKHIR